MPDNKIKSKEDFPVDLKKVGEASAFLDRMKEMCIEFLKVYQSLNKKERDLVGTLACSLTSPWGLDKAGEFDAFIGDPFKIEASVTRLMWKMKHPPVPKGARMPAIAPARSDGPPTILAP